MTTSVKRTRCALSMSSWEASIWKVWTLPMPFPTSWGALPTTRRISSVCSSTATSTASSQAGRTIRSSLQLEREANRNVELMWLLRLLAVETRVVAPAEDHALSALLLFHRQILGARYRVPPCAILRTRHYQSVSVWRSNGNKNRLAVRGKPKWGIIGIGCGSSIMIVA
jgi:hypothetical protein